MFLCIEPVSKCCIIYQQAPWTWAEHCGEYWWCLTGDAQIEKSIHYTMSICDVPWFGLELTRKDSQKSLLNPARLVIGQDLQVCDLLISYLNAFYCPPLKVLLPTFKMLQICAVSLATTTGRHGHCPLDRLNHQNKPSHGEAGEKI